MTDFQNQVNTQPAPAVEGDWASANPRFFANAGPGGFVAGVGGVNVARAVWAALAPTDVDNAPQVLNNFGSGNITGIVHRDQQGLIQTYLSSSGMNIPQGVELAACIGGDLWVKNNGSTQALLNQKAYAKLSDGSFAFAATASPPGSSSGSSSTIAASTSSVTGSISGNVMTVTAVGSGTLYAGTTLSGTNVATGTQIVSQLTPLLAGEATGGIGRYLVSIPEQSVAAGTTISGTYGTLTLGGTIVGTVLLGGLLSGSGVAAGTYVTQFITGTGGAGTYVVNNNTVVGSPVAITITSYIETKWFAVSQGNAGELVKISDHALG